MEVREGVKSTEHFNHNYLGWVIGVECQIINSERETNGSHFGGLFNPFHRESRLIN